MYFLALIGAIVAALALIGLLIIDFVSSPSAVDARAFLSGEPNLDGTFTWESIVTVVFAILLLGVCALSILLFVKRWQRGDSLSSAPRVFVVLFALMMIIGGGFYAYGCFENLTSASGGGTDVIPFGADGSLLTYGTFGPWFNPLGLTASAAFVVQGLGLFTV